MKKLFYPLCIGLLLFLTTDTGYARVNPKRMYKTIAVLTSDSLGGRAAGSGYDFKSARYIEKELRKTGFTPLYGKSGICPFSFRQGRDTATTCNVLMVWKNKKHPDARYILLGAHHDHLGIREKDNSKVIFRGANDNASGVATLLEVAWELYQNRNKLQHHIIIAAFGAEEIGLLGSRQVFTALSRDSIPLECMFNFEMTGTLDQEKNVEILGQDTFDMESVIAAVKNPQQLNLLPRPARLHASDHLWFLKQCPVAVFATTGAQYYHVPEDDISTLNFPGLATLTQYIAGFVLQLSVTPKYNF